MEITKDSHLDHELSTEQVEYIREKFADREEFFLTTIELPSQLGTISCGLHGPLMGDAPVEEHEVEYASRNGRPGESRLCSRPPRQTRLLSVIGGPHEGKCILYTAFGGPIAPREPFDPSLDHNSFLESARFWMEHALSR